VYPLREHSEHDHTDGLCRPRARRPLQGVRRDRLCAARCHTRAASAVPSAGAPGGARSGGVRPAARGYVEGAQSSDWARPRRRGYVRARNRATGLDRGAEGPEGTWPLYQAEALAKTAASVSSVLDAMEAQQLSLEGVKLAAFVNESGTESSFGKADMRTQYSHPDQQHYCERKPAGLTRAINPVVRAPGDVAV